MANPEYPYSQDKFDAGYYGGRARGGFGDEIHWSSPVQQRELKKKYATINRVYDTILFVGCALGNEVRYFRERGKEAFGVDISEYAIAHCDSSIKDYVKLYNGWELKDFADKSMDVIAAFDVLTLVPDDMLQKLVREMCRVSNSAIVFRTIIDYENKLQGKWVGNDGVTFRYLTYEQWESLFEQEGFHVAGFKISPHHETVFVMESHKQ